MSSALQPLTPLPPARYPRATVKDRVFTGVGTALDTGVLRAMQLVVDGRIRTEALHSDSVSLDQIQPAFDALLSGGEQVKVLVDPRL